MRVPQCRRMLLLGFAILLAAGLRAESPVSLKIATEPRHGLPNIPPSLVLELRNNSGQQVTVSNRFAMQVTAGKERFVATWTGLNKRVLSVHEAYLPLLVLPPHGRQQFVLGASLEEPEFFCDPHFGRPDTYKLQLISDASLESSRLRGPDILLSGNLADPIISNEILYLVDQPTGDDLAVWRRMQQLAVLPCSAAHGAALAKEIWEKYPKSRYADYFIPRYPNEPVDRFVARLQEAIRRDPSSADDLRMTIAALTYDQMQTAIFREHDSDKAERLAETVRGIVQSLAKSNSQPALAASAAELAASVPSDDEIEKLVDEVRGIVADRKPIVPFITCAKSNGHVIAYGYENPNSFTVSVPIGALNRFDPAPADRGQPTAFKPGRHENVLTIKTKDQDAPPRWTLDGKTLAPPEENVGECKDDSPDD